jgi:hypothetical protein
VLDKERDAGLTDGRFLLAMKRASRDGTGFYTENQLYTALCRPLYPQNAVAKALAWWGIGGAAAAILWFSAGTGFGVFVAIAAAIGGLATIGKRWSYSPLDRSRLPEWIRRMKQGGHEFKKLLANPSLQNPPPEWKEPDIYNYGVERILIVERPLLVDLLVKNGFHAENRALVVSEEGYPPYIMQHVRRLADERPDLPIFLLHDATAAGVNMKKRISRNPAFSGLAQRAVDLGAFPSDFEKLGLPALRGNRDGWSLPVDTLNAVALGGLVGAAFIDGGELAHVIAQKKAQEDYSGVG